MKDSVAIMTYLRRGTLDSSIWRTVLHEYAALPLRFEPGEVALDIGCHVGSFALFAAERGARVLAFEANRENYALACINTRDYEQVEIHLSAVWRSDRPSGELIFTPHPDGQNTGGGSVLFRHLDDHRAYLELGNLAASLGDPSHPILLTSHPVPSVGLDAILSDIDREVRYLKIDVEGAEFPVLATATMLRRIETIGGEYHELNDAQMRRLPEEARVGEQLYDRRFLLALLEAAGFDVDLHPTAPNQGLFVAQRRS